MKAKEITKIIVETYGEPYSDIDSMTKEVHKRYGSQNIYSKQHTNPTATIFYHKNTGFSLASWGGKDKGGSIYPEHDYHKKLRLDKKGLK
jgi:hypothetical protein